MSFKRHNLDNKKRGQSLLEVIAAIALFALIVSALVSLATGGFTGIQRGGDQTEAEAIAQEAIEAVRSIRDDGWKNLIFSTSSVQISGGGWTFTGEGTTETIGNFTRSISFHDVCRDVSHDIVPCPGTTTDVHTKEVRVLVTWEPRPGITNEVRKTGFITNWQSRQWVQTDWIGGSGFTIWSDLNPDRYDTDDGNVDVSTAGQATLDTGVSIGGTLERWIPGGGSQILHTSKNDFDGSGGNLPTFNNTEIIGSGVNASIGLAQTPQWGSFVPSVESGDPQGLFDLHFSAADVGYGIGEKGTVMLWNGTNWSAEVTVLENENHEYNAVFTRTDSDVWIVGKSGVIIRWNGFNWKQIQSPTTRTLHDVHILSATDGWAVGENGEIIHWNGAIWQIFTSPTNKKLFDLHMNSATDGWAVGENGNIFKWNGTAWSSFTSPTSKRLNSVDFADASNGWAVGENGTIIYYNGTSWSTQSAPTSDVYEDVSAVSATDVWAVGEKGVIIHTTDGGSNWSTVTSPVGDHLYGIDMITTINGQIAGGHQIPTILEYDGVSWEEIGDELTKDTIYGMDMLSSSDGWAVGQKAIVYQWNGSNWLTISTPIDKDLRAVDFVDASNGWTVGEAGNILYYNGTSWASQTSGTGDNLFGVSFVDTSNGWAVGDSGTIRVTTNGGTTWSAQSSGTGNILYDVHFVNTSTGWSVGAGGTVLKTTNGGTTWTSQLSSTVNDLYSVHFVDTSNGWAVGESGTIIRTTDGGTNWSVDTSGTSEKIWGVHALTTSDGWVVADKGELIHWNGSTWTATTSPITKDLQTVFMVSSDDVWAGGEQSNLVHYFDLYYLSGTYISPVIDSGKVDPSWDFVKWLEDTLSSGTDLVVDIRTGPNDTPPGSWSDFEGSFTEPLGDVINSPDDQYIQYRLTLTTSDSTKTPLLKEIRMDYDVPTNQNLNTVHMLSDTVGFAGSVGGFLFKYTGTAWVTQSSGTSDDINGVYFISTTEGWAVADSGTILHTTNAGSSWSSQTSGTGNDLQAVFFTDTNNGWAVGNAGTIVTTSDGGSNWSSQTSGTANALNSLYFIDSSNGWAVGNSGTILHTTNGGTNWNSQTSGTANDLNDVDFTSSSEGWAVGVGGVILHTTNTGSTWTTRISPVTTALNGIDFFVASNGWAVGDDGIIIEYEGIDWFLSTSPVVDDLNDVSLGTASDGWSVGDGGLFMHLLITSEEGAFETSGSLRSSGFDMGGVSTVQTIDWDQVIPACAPTCEVTFQLSTAPDSAGTPGTYSSWYGDTGVDTFITFQSGGKTAPVGLPTNQWVRYQVFFTGDGTNAPTLEEVRIDYQ